MLKSKGKVFWRLRDSGLCERGGVMLGKRELFSVEEELFGWNDNDVRLLMD